MTNNRTPRTHAGTSKSELTEAQLNIVSGVVVSPRDPASGLPTGKRSYKPYAFRAEFKF